LSDLFGDRDRAILRRLAEIAAQLPQTGSRGPGGPERFDATDAKRCRRLIEGLMRDIERG
jgi:hypothetical protein